MPRCHNFTAPTLNPRATRAHHRNRRTAVHSGTICGKGEEVPGRFPRVLNVLPWEKIECPPRDFLKANPRPHPRPDQRPKPEGPQGFLAFGPVEGVAKGLHLENPEEGIQYWVLTGHPEGSIHQGTSEAFPQILILFT